MEKIRLITIELSLKPKLEQLFSYLYHKEKYGNQLISSIRNELYDFAIILLWKVFVLFVYEKLYQIPSETILNKWEKHFNEKKPKGFKHDSLYWPNNEDDSKIMNFLYELYDIDKNVIKIANSLSQKRNAAAHVSELEFDLSQVENFLDDTLTFCQKIQRAHEKYLEEIDAKTIDVVMISKKLSTQDIKFFIKKFINLLKKSSSFCESTEIREKILNFKKYLSTNDIIYILEAIKQNSLGNLYHQILQAGGADNFIRELYQIYNKPSPQWKEFAEFIVKYLKARKGSNSNFYLVSYNWLFEIFNMENFKKEEIPLIESSDDELDVKNIPF